MVPYQLNKNSETDKISASVMSPDEVITLQDGSIVHIGNTVKYNGVAYEIIGTVDDTDKIRIKKGNTILTIAVNKLLPDRMIPNAFPGAHTESKNIIMKKSDLIKIIKEELLKEFGSKYSKMDSIIDVNQKKNFQTAVSSIQSDLENDGFEREEIMQFFNGLIEDVLGPNMREGVIKEYDAAAIASGFRNPIQTATTRDYKEVKVGDKVKYYGNPLIISKIYSQTGKTMIFAESQDKVAFVTDIASRFTAG